MSILQNNAQALVRLRTTDRATLKEKFGVYEPVAGKVVGALYNADTDGLKRILLHSNPAGVVAGLKILTELTGAAGAVLYTEEGFDPQTIQADAGQVGLPIELLQGDMVDKRRHAGDLLVPLDQLAALAEQLMDRTPGVLVCVDDGEPVEVPADTTLDTLVEDGSKAVLADHRFYCPDELPQLRADALQSGMVHTFDDTHCMVCETGQALHTLRQKSCGKCTFCREGLYQLSEIIQSLSEGRAKAQDLALAQEIGRAMTVSCNCSLGEQAAQPALSLLYHFAPEAEAHYRAKQCPAGVCLALTQLYIDPALCRGSGDCAAVCPAQCIQIKAGYVSVIDSFDCTRCGKCLTACGAGAVKQVSGRAPRLPDRPVRIKGGGGSRFPGADEHRAQPAPPSAHHADGTARTAQHGTDRTKKRENAGEDYENDRNRCCHRCRRPCWSGSGNHRGRARSEVGHFGKIQRNRWRGKYGHGSARHRHTHPARAVQRYQRAEGARHAHALYPLSS